MIERASTALNSEHRFGPLTMGATQSLNPNAIEVMAYRS